MVGPVSPANRSPAFGVPPGLGLGLGVPVGVPLGLGLGLGVPVGVPEGLGLGVPVGVPDGLGLGVPVGVPLGLGLGLAHGDGLGFGLGLPLGEPVGDGVAEPNVPASTTSTPFSTCTGIPDVTAGTFDSIRNITVWHEVTVVCQRTALFTAIVITVPAARLTDQPSTSRRLRP